MKKLLIVLFLPVLLLSGCTKEIDVPSKPDELLKATVSYVIDGDTFVCSSEEDVEMKVRLIGVDAPESVHPDEDKNTEAGKDASFYTKDFLEGKTVELEFDVQEEDKYGRKLCYVWIDNELFNKRILDDGYAALFTVPPNIKYVDYLRG